jgi:hypothetical protein
MRTYVRVVVSAVIVGAIAGVVIVAMSPADKPSPPVASALDPAPPAPSTAAPTVPDLAGASLDVAEGQLEDLGIAHDVVGGGLLGIIDRSAWEVCATSPAAGEEAPPAVTLYVERPGDC